MKDEHKHPTGLLQPLHVPEWKWEVISLDFINRFPRTRGQHDSIMSVVEKLTKYAHFILVKATFKAIDIIEIFLKEIFRLHGVPNTIISNRDVKFTSKFWKALFEGLDKQLGFSITYHPQMDGHTQRTNQVL